VRRNYYRHAPQFLTSPQLYPIIAESFMSTAELTAPSEGPPPPNHPLVRMLDLMHAEVVLGDPQTRHNFLDNMTYEEYSRWMLLVNWLGRGAPYRGQPGATGRDYAPATARMAQQLNRNDNSFNSGVLYVSPHPSLRASLMNDAFAESRQIADPDTRLTFLGVATVAIHPLIDWTSRTVRFGYNVLGPRGYQGTDDDRAFYNALLDREQGMTMQDLHPAHAGLLRQFRDVRMANLLRARHQEHLNIAGVIGAENFRGLAQALPSADIDDITRGLVMLIAAERDFNLLTLTSYLLVEHEDYPEPFLTEDREGNRYIDVHALLGSMSGQECARFIQIHDWLKEDFITDLTNCFVYGNETVFGPAAALVELYRPKWPPPKAPKA